MQLIRLLINFNFKQIYQVLKQDSFICAILRHKKRIASFKVVHEEEVYVFGPYQHTELNSQHRHLGLWLRLSLRLLQCFCCPGISHIPKAHACHIQPAGLHTHPCHVFPNSFTKEEKEAGCAANCAGILF